MAQDTEQPTHTCYNGVPGYDYAWWARDAQGIELCKVCDQCEAQKLAQYAPHILTGYSQADVDEPIEAEDY